MKNISKKTWISIVLLMIILLVFVLVWMNMDNLNFARYFRGNETLSSEAVASLVIQQINRITEGMAQVELIETTEESGVYKVRIRVDGGEFNTYATKDGKLFFPEGVVIETGVVKIPERTIGNFIKTGEEICLENGRPIIYYFGRSECPFCQWQQPVITAAMQSFAGYVVFKDNTDTENDMDVFSRLNERGSVPFILAGCKYSRLGAGGRSVEDEQRDIDIISALACDLTGGQPQQVCQGLNHLIEQL